MRRAIICFLAAVLVAGCAALQPEHEGIEKCSNSPKNSVTVFLRGMSEFSLGLLRSVTPKGSSLWKVFGDGNEKRGEAVVRELIKHPELTDGTKGCLCSLLQMQNTADPHEKIVTIKRITFDDDDREHDYRRSFLVRFDSDGGNCITRIDAVEKKWVRIG